jgi:type IV pilus assembly protein PilM
MKRYFPIKEIIHIWKKNWPEQKSFLIDKLAKIKSVLNGKSELKNLFKKEYVVGLDIGTYSIKMVRCALTLDGGLSVEDFIFREDVDTNIESLLAELSRDINFKNSKIIVGINCKNTLTKIFTIPFIPQNELYECISLVAEEYFSFPISDAYLDFEILDVIEEEGIQKYKVLTIISPKATVEKYYSLLKSVNINPDLFVPVSYALCSFISSCNEENKINSIIDIGHASTELVICRGEEILLSRKILVAGIDFTKAMMTELVSNKKTIHLSHEEAQKIKHEVGIPLANVHKLINKKITTSQILAITRMSLDQIINEISNCLDIPL